MRQLRPTIPVIMITLVAASVLMTSPGTGTAAPTSPPFTQCPPVGLNTSCAVLIIVNPDTQGMAKAPKITPAAAKAAIAAGVKNAALIHVVTIKKPSVPDSTVVKLDKPQWEKASFNPPPAKQLPKKAVHRKAKPKARAKKASPKGASKPASAEGATKPAAKPAASGGAARSTPASSKKKPSAAVAKNHDPQDHP